MAAFRAHPSSRHDSDRPDPNGWQIVYTGFVLILLCFFIMLTSFASLQKSKITQFTQAFSSAVSVFEAGKALENGQTMIDSRAAIVNKEDKIARLFEKVRSLSGKYDLSQITIRKTRNGVAMMLSENLLFDSGDARLTLEAQPLIKRLGHVIQEIAIPVEIQGHTDSRPIHTNAFPSNWELSTARAVNVLRFLVHSQGIDPNRISAVGFAEFQPLVPNNTVDNRAANRRVEVVFKID
jgi:chemotaxis protein MotB